jgi:hypothetical protein
MPIYERPTKSLMVDWAKENLSPGQSAAVQWFGKNYPKIKSNTVNMHVEGMAVNNPVRKHHPSEMEPMAVLGSINGRKGLTTVPFDLAPMDVAVFSGKNPEAQPNRR